MTTTPEFIAYAGVVLTVLVAVLYVLLRATADWDDTALLPPDAEAWDPFAPPPPRRPRMHDPCLCATPGLAPDPGALMTNRTPPPHATRSATGVLVATFPVAIDVAHRRAVNTGRRHCVHREPTGVWYVHLAHPKQVRE